MSFITTYRGSLLGDCIDMPDPVKTFFSQRGKYIPLPLEERIAIPTAYKAVEDDAEDIPSEYFNDEKLVETAEEYPCRPKGSGRRGERAAINSVKFIFGPGHYSDIRKTYMINTGTMPIRVNYKKDGTLSRNAVYVKRPDANRIVGWFFYEIISGINNMCYGFNEAVFLEKGLPAAPLSRCDESKLLHPRNRQRYLTGLVKAAAHAEFIALDADVCNPRNRLIDGGMKTLLFDFNLMFHPKKNAATNFLIAHYSAKHDHTGQHIWNAELVDTYYEEMHAVAKRIEKKHKCFFKLARMAGSLTDLTCKSLDERVRHYYGARSLEEYFEKLVRKHRG